MLNPRLIDTGTPPIPEAQGWAARYDGRAGPLIDLSQAVPGYPPHPDLLRRLGEVAADRASASYGPIAGDHSLREAYAAHLNTLHGGEVAPDEVAITTGCNQAFFVAAVALAGAGDNLLLPCPWYFNHQMALAMLGIEPRPLPCPADAGFVPDPEDAEALIDARTRAIVLVTPNNPTGAVYPPDTVHAFAALCRRRGIALILDETYRDFREGRPHGLFADPDWGDTLVGLYSFSKAYCIPGHRIGAMTASRAAMAEIAKVLDTLQICAPRTGQMALAWAIPALADWRAGNLAEIGRRADAFRAAVGGVPGWRIEGLGAYFAFLRHPGGTAADAARRLVEQSGVLCLPGSYFGPGQEGHLRVAFANAAVEALRAVGERLRALG